MTVSTNTLGTTYMAARLSYCCPSSRPTCNDKWLDVTIQLAVRQCSHPASWLKRLYCWLVCRKCQVRN